MDNKINIVIKGVLFLFCGVLLIKATEWVYLFICFTNQYNSKIPPQAAEEVRQVASAYLAETYPDEKHGTLFVEWDYSGFFVVTYYVNGDTGNQTEARSVIEVRNPLEVGKARKLAVDHTRTKIYEDYYIKDESDRIINGYTKSIETKIREITSFDYVSVYLASRKDYLSYDNKRRRIVLEGEDISHDPVDCTFIMSGDKISKAEFAEIILQTVEILKKSDVPIEALLFICNYSYRLTWSDDMLTMTPEELAECIK